MDDGNKGIIYRLERRAPKMAARRFGMRSLLCRVGATLRLWAARERERDALSRLDDHLLRDIGLARETARREWTKPFWRD